MRYSIEPKFRKYIKGYGFLLFATKIGNKYGKKLIDTATKTGIDAAKTTSKRIVRKTSIGNPKEKETKKTEAIYIPPEKRQQIINHLRLFLKI